MSRPTPLSGFPELLPAQQIAERRVLATLAEVFELHGFAPLETRAVEPLDQLLRKGETSKEIYVLRRLQEAESGSATGATGPGGVSGGQSGGVPGGVPGDALALHFDLTVPFARYVLEHAGKLEFPFRRYQIQKVWRGERPQEGRFREFTQADIDVVGRDALPFHHDIEVARVMVDALSRLDFLPPFTLQVNNRRLIEGFYRGLGVEDVAAAMRVVDKLDKLPPGEVGDLLVSEAGLTKEQAAQCLRLAEISVPDSSFATQVRDLGVEHELLETGLQELVAVVDGCRPLTSDRVQVRADLRIARGLDYYTGTVFETRLHGHEQLGSICSGGRYDALAADGRATYPGVGISLGVSRLLVPLFQSGRLVADRSVPSAVLVALPDEDSRPACDALAQRLRERGISAEVAAAPQKFGKQIRYADRRGIPFVWFADGSSHEVKDIRSGEQGPADPESWLPPEADRRPRLIHDEGDPR